MWITIKILENKFPFGYFMMHKYLIPEGENKGNFSGKVEGASCMHQYTYSMWHNTGSSVFAIML